MKKHTYIIGEIGQNHNGSVDIAKLIVDLVRRPIKEEDFVKYILDNGYCSNI